MNIIPYIIIKTKYPGHINPDAVKKYMEVLKDFPPERSIGKEVVQLAVKATTKGLKTMYIMEVKQGQLDAAFTRSMKAMAPYLDIAGYNYSIELWATGAEALQTIGHSMPER